MHYLHSTEIYTSQDYVVMYCRLDVALQWGLSIEFNGYIDNVASYGEAIRRSICPTSCEVNAYGASAPYYLVGIYAKCRVLELGLRRPGKSFGKERKSTRSVYTTILSTKFE